MLRRSWTKWLKWSHCLLAAFSLSRAGSSLDGTRESPCREECSLERVRYVDSSDLHLGAEVARQSRATRAIFPRPTRRQAKFVGLRNCELICPPGSVAPAPPAPREGSVARPGSVHHFRRNSRLRRRFVTFGASSVPRESCQTRFPMTQLAT